jgi:Protein of unknown function (DUF3108)
MKMPPFARSLCLALVLVATAAAAAPPLPAFTAHYRLLRNGSPIGQATLTLEQGADGNWTFTTDSKGTAGLAALIGASTHETSTFRWVGDLPQGESYDYAMQAAFKQKQRSVRFDWADKTATVNDKGEHRYPVHPGTLERHTVPLAIAAGLDAGKRDFALPVAVRDRVQIQHYAVQGDQTVSVPAGTYHAVRVVRTDHDAEAFDGWFVPGKLAVPVRLVQRDRDTLELALQDYKAR